MPSLNVQPTAVAAEPASRSVPGALYLQAGGFALLGIAALSAFARRRRLGLALGLMGALLLLPAFVSLPAPAQPATAAVPTETRSAAEIGADLFQSKGCIACHQHDAIAVVEEGGHIGPNLSHYQPDPPFVRAWLRDPAAVRPETQMPNLGLNDEEIEALLAFLTESRVPLAAGREACPITQPPTPAFEPPVSQGVRRALASDDHFWYGSPELWTRREIDGFWHSLPHHEDGYTQKQVFWSEGYNWREEQDPALVLTGRRLDGDETMTDTGASNAYHPDYGSMIMTGFVLPAAGCWEITANYGETSLSFVVWVEP
jgi:mono/diheme cytochrome c family protein